MKILTVLFVVQIAALAALFLKFDSLESNLNSLVVATSAVSIGEIRAVPASRAVPSSDAGISPDNIQQLRRIVREELTAALQSQVSQEQSAQRLSTAPAQQIDNQRPEREYDHQRRFVQDEIDYFVSQGTISEAEMAGLQMQIGKLDPAGRRDMLRELVKVLNSSELEGRL